MRGEVPHKKIGGYLKARRERLNESVAEVSYAVEIDIETLQKIEAGQELPSEDILVLLLSHLQIDEAPARRLLALAGYDDVSNGGHDTPQPQVFMVMPGNQVQYTDDHIVQAEKNGIILNFFQPGLGDKQVPAARLGLTKTQAKQLLVDLHAALHTTGRHQQRLLPKPKQQK